METFMLIVISFINWAILIGLYLISYKIGFTNSDIVTQIPFKNGQGKAFVSFNLITHFVISTIFTLVYTFLLSVNELHHTSMFFGFAILFGLIHGAAVAMGMVILTTGLTDGLRQVVMVFVAHALFGLLTAIGLSIAQNQVGVMDHMASWGHLLYADIMSGS